MPNEIEVTSTTSTEQEVEHTASENWREPFEPKDLDAEKEASEGEQPESASESETETEGEKPEPKKGKGGFQKRIDKLTRRNYELEERLAEAEGRLAGKTAATSQPTPEASSKPTPESFRTYEEYVEALADWKAEQRIAKARQDEAKQTQQQRQKEAFESYNAKALEASERYEDWNEVVGNPAIKIPAVAHVAIIEADNGPDIAYYLGKDQELREHLLDLNEISEAKVIMEIGRLSAFLAADAEKESPKPKPGTKAAPPIKPVGGSSTKSTVPLGEMPYPQYAKIRNEQERARRGR